MICTILCYNYWLLLRNSPSKLSKESQLSTHTALLRRPMKIKNQKLNLYTSLYRYILFRGCSHIFHHSLVVLVNSFETCPIRSIYGQLIVLAAFRCRPINTKRQAQFDMEILKLNFEFVVVKFCKSLNTPCRNCLALPGGYHKQSYCYHYNFESLFRYPSPPSTTISCPVIWLEASEARNRIVWASSSAVGMGPCNGTALFRPSQYCKV